METFSEYCFREFAKQSPFDWPAQLEKSPVTDADIRSVETNWGFSLPNDFKEFLKSYILPEPTVAYGKFFSEYTDCWPGGGMTYSHELGRYLQWEEVPEGQTLCTLKFILSGLEELADTREHSLQKNIERLSWTKTAPLGYIFIGEFTDNLIFLECETGAIVYVDHDFYTISSQTEIENIKEYKQLLFKRFSDLLRCLFLGIVCNAETAELNSDNCD